MKKSGDILNLWTYNGSVYFTFTEEDEPYLAEHISDIDYYGHEYRTDKI